MPEATKEIVARLNLLIVTSKSDDDLACVEAAIARLERLSEMVDEAKPLTKPEANQTTLNAFQTIYGTVWLSDAEKFGGGE